MPLPILKTTCGGIVSGSAFFSGVRARLMLLVLLAVLPAVGLTLYLSHQSGEFAARHTLEDAMRLVRLASTDYERLVESTHHLLGALARLPDVRRHNTGACSALLAEIKPGYPHYANLGAIRPDGRVFCSATPMTRAVNASDRAYFRRAVETRDFAAGDYQIGRITGKPVVVFAHPAHDPAGRLQAVAFAAFDLTWLNRLAAGMQLPTGTTLTILDSQGTVLNRWPDPEKWIGKSMADLPLKRAILTSQEAGTLEAAGHDGVPRLYAFAPLWATSPDRRAYLSVGIPHAAAYAEVDRIVARTLGGLAFVAVLVLAAAWYGGDVFLLRRINALVTAARRLARGEHAHTGIGGDGEIGLLARAFDDMADAIAAREKEIRHADKALRESEERFRSLVETTSDWIWEVDARGVYTYTSPKVGELLGYAPEEVLGKTPFDLMPPEEAERVGRAFGKIAAAQRPFERLENTNLHKDGRRVVLETSGVPLFDREGRFAGYRGMDRDVTERVRTEERLRYLAYHDELTGLPNRALLLDRVKQAVIEARRHGRQVAVICLDIDRFKFVNEAHGHVTGDAVLKAAADRLSACVRPGDTVARLGGDEFAVALSDIAHVDDIGRIVQKIMHCADEPLATGDNRLFVTLSIGITLFPLDGDDPETLLKNAAVAMHQAKQQGGNGHQYYSAQMAAEAAEHLALENSLRLALERREFVLHYQPQVSLYTGAVTGVEALIRWRHPKNGLISPAKFIPLAEETGLIVPIGDWVLATACAQMRTWREAGLPPLRVAVNLSAQHFKQPGLDESVRRILRETGADPRRLDVELTESTLAQNPETVLAVLHNLEQLGVQISVDDFGTGYSSLSYLKRFPVDVLKIDQSFVRGVVTDPDDAALVVAIISMAHALRIQTLAEGVETKEQLEFLRKHRCDAMQGYYFSKPLPAEDVAVLLKENRGLAARG